MALSMTMTWKMPGTDRSRSFIGTWPQEQRIKRALDIYNAIRASFPQIDGKDFRVAIELC